MRLFDKGTSNNSTVLKHIFKIHEITVKIAIDKVITVMEVNYAQFVGIYDILGKQNSFGQISGDLASHVISLSGIDYRVLVRVLFFGLLVYKIYNTQNLIIGGVLLSDKVMSIAISDVALRHLVVIGSHDLSFNQVLNFFYADDATMLHTSIYNILYNGFDNAIWDLVLGQSTVIRFIDSISNFIRVKIYNTAISLVDFHVVETHQLFIPFLVFIGI